MQKINKYSEAKTTKTNPYIEYVSKFKEIHSSPVTLQQFGDGLVLLDLVRLIKDFSIVGGYEDNPRTFAHRFTNLKILFKSIEHFWQNILACEVEGEEIDLVQIAHTSNKEQLDKLLELFIKTAAQAENKWIFIEKILETSQTTQQYLKRVIEKVIGNESKESPRKEKEKRMYDKILELDHENDKLHQVMEAICDQKLELEGKVKILSDKLQENRKEVERLQSMVEDYAYTPEKKRYSSGITDVSDRKDSQIEILKKQIADMTITHEKQLQQYYTDAEKLLQKAQKYDNLKNELDLYRAIIDSNKEFIEDAKLMEEEFSQMRATVMDKNNKIQHYSKKYAEAQAIIKTFEKSQCELQLELERKNKRLNELTAKIEHLEKRMSPKKGESHNNLYLEFPEIINTEAEAYIETNRNLREQLERTRKRLEKSEEQLDKSKQEIESLRKSDIQNRKLREMVIDMTAHRGEQNEILIHSLYFMRKMLKQKCDLQKDSTLKDLNRLSKNLFSK